MNQLNYKNFFFLTVLLMAFSCKVPMTSSVMPDRKMPDIFFQKEDSVTIADIQWKNYFSDKYLIAIIDSALKNNFDVKIALERIQAAESEVILRNGASKPILNGIVNSKLTKYGNFTMDGAGNKNTVIYDGKNIPTYLPDYFAGFQASWEIDAWGKIRSQKKAAAARLLASVEGKNLVITNLIAKIVTVYIDLLSYNKSLNILDETIQIQQKAFETVKLQKEAAETNELAVKEFEAQLLNLKSLRFESVQLISEKENELYLLLGSYPRIIQRDSSYFDKPITSQIKSGIPASILRNRPDIRQAELELMATKADLMAAKAAFYPTVNISAGLGLQAFQPALLFKPESIFLNVLGNLTAPLINKSAIKASFKQANSLQLQALYQYQKSILNGYVDTYNEIQRIKNLQTAYDLKLQEVLVLSKSIEIASDLFRFGRANYLEVLITQQNSIAAKLALVQIKKNQLVATVNLYKALGGGWK